MNYYNDIDRNVCATSSLVRLGDSASCQLGHGRSGKEPTHIQAIYSTPYTALGRCAQIQVYAQNPRRDSLRKTHTSLERWGSNGKNASDLSQARTCLVASFGTLTRHLDCACENLSPCASCAAVGSHRNISTSGFGLALQKTSSHTPGTVEGGRSPSVSFSTKQPCRTFGCKTSSPCVGIHIQPRTNYRFLSSLEPLLVLFKPQYISTTGVCQ
jgi:hypothetical protein